MTIVSSRLRRVLPLVLVAAMGSLAPSLEGQSLRGSSASLDAQNRQARSHDFTYLRTSSQVRRFVDSGYLVPVRPDADFDLHAVSFPFARPEVELFIKRLAGQYRAACGEKLVVTSLTRPQNRQPANASSRSVHPTGMAVDLRRSNVTACRRWLESVLLDLERGGVLEATRENYPPHYHVALYPRVYDSYVQRVASRAEDDRAAPASRTADVVAYQVRRGDSLWTIARAHGITVNELRSRNELDGSRIYAGQVLQVPASSR